MTGPATVTAAGGHHRGNGTERRTITVGVDDSEASREAVRWAAREAGRRRARVLVIHAVDITILRRRAGSEAWIDAVEQQLAAESSDLFERARTDAGEVDAGVVVETRWEGVDPVSALRAASRDARLVVLGWTGRGVLGTALGSVTLAVASHADCPVVVVRGTPLGDARSLPVLVGVDGGPSSDVALAHAFDAAWYGSDPLRALHVWTDADVRRAHLDLFVDPWPAMREAEERLLTQRLAEWRQRYPEVDVDGVVEHADPRTALAEHSGRSRLVVVATHGRGGLAGLLLGSTGIALIQHAQCPVMLVGPDARRPESEPEPEPEPEPGDGGHLVVHDRAGRDAASTDVAVGGSGAGDDRRTTRGRRAGRVLVACVVAVDLVFLVGAVTNPTWWRTVVLVVLLVVQGLVAVALRRSP